MSYKGPQWEGIGVPKTNAEEKNPKFRMIPKTGGPKDDPNYKEPERGFEYVVR